MVSIYLVQHHQLQQAEQDINKCLQMNPKHAFAFASRGVINSINENYQEALNDFEEARRLNKETENLFLERKGLIFSYLGRYKEAIKIFEKELIDDPEDNSATYNLIVARAKLYGLTDTIRLSIKTLSSKFEALTKDNNDEVAGKALYGLGGLEALCGNSYQALNHLAQAEKLNKSVNRWARNDPAWEDLRTEEQFISILSEP